MSVFRFELVLALRRCPSWDPVTTNVLKDALRARRPEGVSEACNVQCITRRRKFRPSQTMRHPARGTTSGQLLRPLTLNCWCSQTQQNRTACICSISHRTSYFIATSDPCSRLARKGTLRHLCFASYKEFHHVMGHQHVTTLSRLHSDGRSQMRGPN
jgi:hypothetical protein